MEIVLVKVISAEVFFQKFDEVNIEKKIAAFGWRHQFFYNKNFENAQPNLDTIFQFHVVIQIRGLILFNFVFKKYFP